MSIAPSPHNDSSFFRVRFAPKTVDGSGVRQYSNILAFGLKLIGKKDVYQKIQCPGKTIKVNKKSLDKWLISQGVAVGASPEYEKLINAAVSSIGAKKAQEQANKLFARDIQTLFGFANHACLPELHDIEDAYEITPDKMSSPIMRGTDENGDRFIAIRFYKDSKPEKVMCRKLIFSAKTNTWKDHMLEYRGILSLYPFAPVSTTEAHYLDADSDAVKEFKEFIDGKLEGYSLK